MSHQENETHRMTIERNRAQRLATMEQAAKIAKQRQATHDQNKK